MTCHKHIISKGNMFSTSNSTQQRAPHLPALPSAPVPAGTLTQAEIRQIVSEILG